MKKTFSLLLAGSLLLTLAQPLQAAQQFDTYEAAQKRVTDEGYILFIYPAGWDKYGEKLCKKLISDDKVRAAAGKAALIMAPIYQRRNEETNAKAKKAMGPLGYPNDMSDISYPALVFYEKGGRMYATLHGEKLMNASVPEVAQMIQQRLAAKKKQQSLLDQSGATADVGKKARLVLEASRVEGIDWPDRLEETLRSIDPNDTHGCLAALDFGFGAQANESMEAFLKRLDGVLKNPLLTNWQKQRACAAAIGHIRRSYGTMAGGPLITKYAGIMRKLDPDSTLGVSAPVVMRDWVREYRYGMGWSDSVIPAGPIPMQMHDVPMQQPGTYNVTFRLTTGRDGIRINRLRLMDGNKCIASEDTPRDVSWGNTRQTYTFHVKKALKNPTLEITYGNEPNKRSTWGNITVSRQ